MVGWVISDMVDGGAERRWERGGSGDLKVAVEYLQAGYWCQQIIERAEEVVGRREERVREMEG